MIRRHSLKLCHRAGSWGGFQTAISRDLQPHDVLPIFRSFLMNYGHYQTGRETQGHIRLYDWFVVSTKEISIWKTSSSLLVGRLLPVHTCHTSPNVQHMKKTQQGAFWWHPFEPRTELNNCTVAPWVCIRIHSASGISIWLFDHHESAHACREINMSLKWHLKCWFEIDV